MAPPARHQLIAHCLAASKRVADTILRLWGAVGMGLPRISAFAAAAACLLVCFCSFVTSSTDADESDCASLVTGEAARAFLRKRAMQPSGELFACEAVEHLGLGGGEFKGNDVRLFVPALLRMRALKTLDVSHMSLDSESIVALAPVLEKLSGLQRLSLNGNSIGKSGAAVLANSVSSSSMEWLQLEHADVGAEGLKLLLPLLRRQSSTLTWLSVENCGIGPDGANALAGVVGGFQHLHELNIARNKLGDSGCAEILDAMPWHSLRKLWLGGNAVSSAALPHIKSNNLVLLDLSSNNLTPSCSTALAATIHLSPDLHTLMLSDNVNFGDAGAAGATPCPL
jgi:Ran GTPase-activating protein (RanGAP) involved in mRNA processing and transport